MINNLQHVGVLGMRWGRRKGRVSSPTIDKRSQDYKTAVSLKKKKISEMSNEELRAFATRMQLEKQYRDLNTSTIAKGRKAVADILINAGKETAKNLVSAQMTEMAKKLMDAAAKK